METLELIIILLVAVIASSLLDQFLHGVSLPLVQIALGAVIAVASQQQLATEINAELLLVLFIAPLHFNESRYVDVRGLWRNRFGITSLATGLVVAIALTVGLTLHAVVSGISLAAACAIGAAFGSTDATAVTSLAKDVKFGKRHESLLMGEALFNDVLGTVGFSCFVALAAYGAFSIVHAGEEVALELFGGMAFGAACGVVIWALLGLIRRHIVENPTVHVMLEILSPFFVYFAGEHLHVGGIIPVVVAGMVYSLMPQRSTLATAQLQLQSKSVWKTIEFVLNGIIFVVLGMQLPSGLAPAFNGTGEIGVGRMLACILLLTLVLEGVRFVWLLAMDMLNARSKGRSVRTCLRKSALESTLAMTFAGAKGGVTLSLILTMPTVLSSGAAFPLRAELVSISAGIIVCTLLLANFAVPHLVPHKSREKRCASYVDSEVALIERVMLSIQADSHLTGLATEGDADEQAPVDARTIAAAHEQVPFLDEVDEPATAIVLKHYSDRLQGLVSHASPGVATHARGIIARCEELCEQADALEYASEDADEDATEAGPLPQGLAARVTAMRAAGEAVDDIQSRALMRELEFIGEMRHTGELTAEHARSLRNDVYVQQLVAD